MEDGPRERLVSGAIALMGERGVHATAVADLLARSGTARNSIYQHFPEGKAALVAEATRVAGSAMETRLEALCAARDPDGVVDGLVDTWVRLLGGTDHTLGCPVAAAALAGDDAPAARDAAGAVFAAWSAILARHLVADGVATADAASLGSFVVTAVEGAIVRCRAERTTRPLEEAREHLRTLLTRSRRSDRATRS